MTANLICLNMFCGICCINLAISWYDVLNIDTIERQIYEQYGKNYTCQ